MKAKELISVLSACDPEGEVLIRREFDDEVGDKMNFKLTEAIVAYASEFELEHQSFDITHFANAAEDARQVVVLSDEPIANYVRAPMNARGETWYTPTTPSAEGK